MNNACSPEEADRVIAMLSSERPEVDLLRLLREEMKSPVAPDQISDETRQRMQEILKKILSGEVRQDQFRTRNRIVSHKFWRYSAAASITIMLGVGAYLLFFTRPKKEVAEISAVQRHFKNDVAPGGNKAVLTLANGTTIVLDRAHNGQVANQGNVKVVKVNSGLLAYSSPQAAGGGQPAVDGKETVVQFNRLSTPRGGQYQLVLPDGSKVWLNAASSIRYPTAFAGKERKVEITGEVYFEVAHDPDKPFRVVAGDMEVEVLGTHFNINAYEDEATINTTLLEGGIKVTEGSHVQMLRPGEQAQLNRDGQIRLVKDANVDAAVAWKNGYFSFDKAGLQAVMHQLSRWYNVDVSYQGDIPPQEFGGEIQRNLNLSQVLSVLKQSQVHFKIEGNKLIVLP